MKLDPDRALRCLLINPEFGGQSFWNFNTTSALVGAKTPAPPLGLLTVAAILPQHWQFRLLDLNAQPFSESDWRWADLVCIGGMMPQQASIRKIIRRAVSEDKYVVVGGADPSSQPSLYKEAHTLIVGEGEEVIPTWLQAWRAGQPHGTFTEKTKPDVTASPLPRYDLIDLSAYSFLTIQWSRGCPYNCEFCDIIELYGRKPRTKTSAQFLKELAAIKALGYSGEIFVVDDNFIGNKVNITRHLLPALIDWNQQNGYPFLYVTEASMNISDDEALLGQMRDAEFRFVFLGIETPDPEVLRRTQKKQNSHRPMLQRIHKLYDYGIIAFGGFILGLDGERDHMDQPMIELIEEACINFAMVGFLVASPNTQLARRLFKEGRLLDFNGDVVENVDQLLVCADSENSSAPIINQTIGGLNFRTDRDRLEIIQDYINVISTIYEPNSYFDRILRLSSLLHVPNRHRRGLFELKRDLLGLVRLAWTLHGDPDTRWLFWRNVWASLRQGRAVLALMLKLMGMYVHYKKQLAYTLAAMKEQIRIAQEVERKLRERDGAKHRAAAEEQRTPATVAPCAQKSRNTPGNSYHGILSDIFALQWDFSEPPA